jgi:cation:H+ antiporter
MFELISAWIQFAVCLVFIGWGGFRLSRYGDVIAEKTGMGGTWIGLILMASVTSLPELVTGVSSVTIANTPDIAVGDVLGSCVFNLLIIVVLDFLYRKQSVYTLASQGHVLSAGFGVVLIGFAGFNVLLSANGTLPALGHVGMYSPIIIVLYAVAMRTVFRYEREHISATAEGAAERYPGLTLKQALLNYAGAAGIVITAALWLPFVGKTLAVQMGWQQSFVGTLFVAFATSVPEVAVTIGALRIGAIDMAIANVLGSNLFDILILAIDDILYRPGPLLSFVSPAHAVTAFSAMMMTGVAIIGLLYRPKTRVFKTVGWTSLFLFSLYLLNTYVIYLYAK